MGTIKQVLERVRTKAHTIDGGIRTQQATSGIEPERAATDLIPAIDVDVEVGETIGRPRIFDADAGTFHGIARRIHPIEGVRPEDIDGTLDFERLRNGSQQGMVQGEKESLNAGRVLLRTGNVERQKNDTRNRGRLPCAPSALQGFLPQVAGRQKVTGGLCG